MNLRFVARRTGMEQGVPAEKSPLPTLPRCGSSFPLFWLLIPQILAYAFCGNAPWASEFSAQSRLIAGMFFLALSAVSCLDVARFFPDSPKIDRAFSSAWKICLPVAAFFIFCAWHIWRTPPLEDWSGKSAREAEAELRVEKTFASQGKNFSGIARAEEISGEGLGALAGTRVWYSIPKSLCTDVPAEGTRLRVSGVVCGIPSENGPDGDGFRGYLRRERVSARIWRVETAEPLPHGDGAFPRWCASAKNFLRARLADISGKGGNGEAGTGFSARAGRILGAMLLGERSALDARQRENFLLAGTMHIFAVSGLHISILSAGLMFFLRKLRAPRVPAWLVMLAALWLYVQIVGAPPSAMRAWMMSVFVFSGCLLGRGKMAFRGLIFSAFVALLLEPAVLDNGGFRLSHFIVAAILLYGVPAAEKLTRFTDFRLRVPESAVSFSRRNASRALRAVVAGICISFAAFLAGTPSVIAMFGICPFSSLAANVVLIPFVFFAACLGAAALAVSCVPLAGTFAGKAVFAIAAVPLNMVDLIASLFSEIPAVAELSFPCAEFGAVGGVMMFALFFFGERLSALRERPPLRFSLPPLALCVFLLLCAC